MNTIELIEYLQTQKEDINWVCKKKETKAGRTLWQNNFFYWLFWEIEKQTPFSSEIIKQYILSRVFWKKEVLWELINNKTQTSKLDKKEAGDLINWVKEFCQEHTINIKYTSSEFESLINSYN